MNELRNESYLFKKPNREIGKFYRVLLCSQREIRLDLNYGNEQKVRRQRCQIVFEFTLKYWII